MTWSVAIEIMAARKGMWTNVAKRLHNPIKIFPFGPDASELMLYGTVAYELHDGRKTTIDWAAHAQLVKEEGRWKFGLYQVYLVGYSKLTERHGSGNLTECRILQHGKMQNEQ
jgi:hypothetical protein